MRSGYVLPFGSLVANTDLSSAVTGVFPVEFDAGVRFRRVSLGAYLQYGWGSMVQSKTTAAAFIANGGGRAETPPCGTWPFSYTCTGSDLKVGIEVQYHLVPGGGFDPWFGYGVGMETMNALVTGQFVGQPVATTLSFIGWNVAVLQVGVDYKLPYVSVGPFVTFDLGRFSSVSLSNPALTETHTIQDPAWHEWLTLGLRGYFDIFIGKQQPSPWRAD